MPPASRTSAAGCAVLTPVLLVRQVLEPDTLVRGDLSSWGADFGVARRGLALTGGFYSYLQDVRTAVHFSCLSSERNDARPGQHAGTCMPLTRNRR